MPKVSKTAVDADLRAKVFNDLLTNFSGDDFTYEYKKINDRQYGVLLTDLNGVERYVRIGAIVAEEREDMSARDLMKSEIKAYNDAQAEKARKAEERTKKAERDKKLREEKKKNENENK